jgi:hypothetical protein
MMVTLYSMFFEGTMQERCDFHRTLGSWVVFGEKDSETRNNFIEVCGFVRFDYGKDTDELNQISHWEQVNVDFVPYPIRIQEIADFLLDLPGNWEETRQVGNIREISNPFLSPDDQVVDGDEESPVLHYVR